MEVEGKSFFKPNISQKHQLFSKTCMFRHLQDIQLCYSTCCFHPGGMSHKILRSGPPCQGLYAESPAWRMHKHTHCVLPALLQPQGLQLILIDV